MNEQRLKEPRHNSIVEVSSDEESGIQSTSAARRHSVIEIESDVSDDEVEFVRESRPRDADVEITGHHQVEPTSPEAVAIDYPGAPPQLRSRPRLPTLQRTRRNRRRPNPPEEEALFVDVHANGRNLRMPFFRQGDLSAMIVHQQRALFRMLHLYSPSDDVSASIMDRLEREDEQTLDRRIEKENVHNRKMLLKKREVATAETEGYSTNISPEVNLMCELCGVVLGEGVPSDFKPDPKYNSELAKYASEFRVNAPWFCALQFFDMDFELSKRAFAARCGHVFCGRCIKNIGNRASGRRTRKVEEMTITNPHIYAPRKCPAEDCGCTFRKGKRTFTELFL